MVPWHPAWQQAQARKKEKQSGDDSSKWSSLLIENRVIPDPTPSPTMNIGAPPNGPFSGNIPTATADNPRLSRTLPSNPWTKNTFSTQWPSTTFETSASTTTQHNPYSDQQTLSSPKPTTVASGEVAAPSSTGGIDGLGEDASGLQVKKIDRSAVYAAAGVVPVIVLAAIGVFVFFCMRKRKKQKSIAAAQAKVDEMKQQPARMSAYMASPQLLPITREPSYTAPPREPPPASPQPVILGPISAGANGNYFTGIDTSDVISVRNDRTGLGDPFADGSSLHEEPPPPYRPRSLAPVSRDASLRSSSLSSNSNIASPLVSPHTSSRTRLMNDELNEPLRSPFDDPRDGDHDDDDDDAVSELSERALRKDRDDLSVVSDLSYQRDPVVVGRPHG